MSCNLTGYYQLPNHPVPQLVAFDALFNTAFMRKYTRYRTFEKFLTGSRFRIESQADFEALPEAKMDIFVQKATRFASWQEMLDFATDLYIHNKFSVPSSQD